MKAANECHLFRKRRRARSARRVLVFLWYEPDADSAAIASVRQNDVPKFRGQQCTETLWQITIFLERRRTIQCRSVLFPKLKIIGMIFPLKFRHELAGGIEFETGFVLLGHVGQRLNIRL